MFTRIKKTLESKISHSLAWLSPGFAKQFLFRKESNLTFSNFHSKNSEAELLLLPFFLKRGFHFIDVGANRGLYCFYAEKVIQQENIIAFEPIPSLAKFLETLFPTSHVEQMAVSEKRGVSVLNIPLHKNHYILDTRSTLEHSSDDLVHGFEKIAVETINLDDYVKKELSLQTSLVKIDVEGHEMKVIAGAKELLGRDRPFLIVEIEQRHHNGDFINVFELIENSGYSIYYLNKSLLRLELVFDASHHFTMPNEAMTRIHNYVCIPKEKESIVESINLSIDKQLGR